MIYRWCFDSRKKKKKKKDQRTLNEMVMFTFLYPRLFCHVNFVNENVKILIGVTLESVFYMSSERKFVEMNQNI